MSTDYVYFFRHIGVKGVKIGKTSGESVLNRFQSFKTYSPNGAEILGFFKTTNGHKSEKELHQRFASQRLKGEFFDISDEIIESVISENNDDYLKAKKLFNEWIADENNNIEKLVELLKNANKINIKNENYSIERELVVKHLKKGNIKKTTTEIFNYLKGLSNKDISLKKLGTQCRISFERTSDKTKGYCYLVDFVLP